MRRVNIIFWNIDTLNDFVEPSGKLYVPGTETIKEVLGKLTQLAKSKSIRVVNSCDYHSIHSAEISDNPDYIHTFPQHCIAGTPGANFIVETTPEDPVIFDYDKKYVINRDFHNLLLKERNFMIRKDDFDVFKGNPITEEIVKILDPDIIVAYGVYTNVCVDYVVSGLANRGYKVYVIEDAIKELPDIPLPFDSWKLKGVEMISYHELEKYLSAFNSTKKSRK